MTLQHLYRSNEHNGNNDIYFPLKLWAWSYKILNLFYFFNSMISENISRYRGFVDFFWIGFNLKSQFNNYVSLFFSLLDNDFRKMNYHPCKCLNHWSVFLWIATNQACEKIASFSDVWTSILKWNLLLIQLLTKMDFCNITPDWMNENISMYFTSWIS